MSRYVIPRLRQNEHEWAVGSHANVPRIKIIWESYVNYEFRYEWSAHESNWIW